MGTVNCRRVNSLHNLSDKAVYASNVEETDRIEVWNVRSTTSSTLLDPSRVPWQAALRTATTQGSQIASVIRCIKRRSIFCTGENRGNGVLAWLLSVSSVSSFKNLAWACLKVSIANCNDARKPKIASVDSLHQAKIVFLHRREQRKRSLAWLLSVSSVSSFKNLAWACF